MDFKKAENTDLCEISDLYNAVCDYLETNINYPHWVKGIYPTMNDGKAAIEEGSLYILKDNERIAGTVIIRHTPEEGYRQAVWKTKDDYQDIYVVYTLAVHPDYMQQGVGKRLLQEIEAIAKQEGCISLRLDVVKGNFPAEKLYQNCGYEYIDTVSLGYEQYGIPWYNLYEKVLGEISHQDRL